MKLYRNYVVAYKLNSEWIDYFMGRCTYNQLKKKVAVFKGAGVPTELQIASFRKDCSVIGKSYHTLPAVFSLRKVKNE